MLKGELRGVQLRNEGCDPLSGLRVPGLSRSAAYQARRQTWSLSEITLEQRSRGPRGNDSKGQQMDCHLLPPLCQR